LACRRRRRGQAAGVGDPLANLRLFMQERWRGLRAVAWGQAVSRRCATTRSPRHPRPDTVERSRARTADQAAATGGGQSGGRPARGVGGGGPDRRHRGAHRPGPAAQRRSRTDRARWAPTSWSSGPTRPLAAAAMLSGQASRSGDRARSRSCTGARRTVCCACRPVMRAVGPWTSVEGLGRYRRAPVLAWSAGRAPSRDPMRGR
jgi:hypothetical protein